jgi:hypothetical protein
LVLPIAIFVDLESRRVYRTGVGRIAIVTAALVVLGACKGREEAAPAPPPAQDASMQKPLPTGMLMGTFDAAAPKARSAARLRSTRGATAGEWIELQPAAPGDSPKRTTFEHFRSDSLFLPLDAMTLLHDTFARAEPGFAPLSPQLLDARALGRLRAELATFAKEWSSIDSARAARERFPTSSLVRDLSSDDEWREARSALAPTIEDLTKLAADLEKKGSGLWVISAQ